MSENQDPRYAEALAVLDAINEARRKAGQDPYERPTDPNAGAGQAALDALADRIAEKLNSRTKPEGE
jgi:hypothetical protein